MRELYLLYLFRYKHVYDHFFPLFHSIQVVLDTEKSSRLRFSDLFDSYVSSCNQGREGGCRRNEKSSATGIVTHNYNELTMETFNFLYLPSLSSSIEVTDQNSYLYIRLWDQFLLLPLNQVYSPFIESP